MADTRNESTNPAPESDKPQVYEVKKGLSGWSFNRRDFLSAAASASAAAAVVASRAAAAGSAQQAAVPAMEVLAEPSDDVLYNLKPGQQFTKVWRLRNNGSAPWGEKAALRLANPGSTALPEMIALPNAAPGEVVSVATDMVAPLTSDVYQSAWVFSKGGEENPTATPTAPGKTVYLPIIVCQPAPTATLTRTGTATPAPTATEMPDRVEEWGAWCPSCTYNDRSMGDTGNWFRVELPTRLLQIEMHLDLPADDRLYFFVYEGLQRQGSFSLIHQTRIVDPGSGDRWYSSGAIDVQLTVDRFYYVGVSFRGSARYGHSQDQLPMDVSFGQLIDGEGERTAGYPPNWTVSHDVGSANWHPFHMRLTTHVTGARPTVTATATPSDTGTPTNTRTQTGTPSDTHTPTNTGTRTNTITPTSTRTQTGTPTVSPTTPPGCVVDKWDPMYEHSPDWPDVGNFFSASLATRLRLIQCWLGLTVASPLYFVVYEGPAQARTYKRIHQSFVASAGPGRGYYQSPDIDVALTPGRYYYIGVSVGQAHSTYLNSKILPPLAVSFGQLVSGGWRDRSCGFPPGPAMNPSFAEGVENPWVMRLTTCPTPATPSSTATVSPTPTVTDTPGGPAPTPSSTPTETPTASATPTASPTITPGGPSLTPTATPQCLVSSPSPYYDDTDQTWTVVNPDANAMGTRVHFRFIDVEHGWDYVYIQDESGTQYQQLTGDQTNVWSVLVPGHVVRVHLTSDSTVTGAGFCLDRVESEIPPTPTKTPTPTNTPCASYCSCVGHCSCVGNCSCNGYCTCDSVCTCNTVHYWHPN